MAGDVFGNGMLQSEQMKLVAAFNHLHIFIDPDPDAATTYAERKRLFDLPRSSWADYDESVLSTGGGIYERSAKSISLSEEAAAVLKLESTITTPDELINATLRADVDLLWNGGIGTYVKATAESHADVGDKANDAIRVNGAQLRVKVVGEGGNLGMTQRGRIEFARNEGRLYTDAIDNAGGVDCSDHEVNIKILLDQVVAEGDLTAKQRTELLEEMTDEVAHLVLIHNYFQTQLLSTERTEAASMVDVHARYLANLETNGLLDRQLERLPDADEMAERRLNGLGLTAPELAVLVAYTKNILKDQLLQSDVPDDEYFIPLLIEYFPTALRERFAEQIKTHPLRREIVANSIANRVVNRGGTTLIYRLSHETSAPAAEIAAAHTAAWAIFELVDLTESVIALDNVMPSDEQMGVHLRGRQLAERATRLLLRSRPYPFDPGSAVTDLGDAVKAATRDLDTYFKGLDKTGFEMRLGELQKAGVPEHMAKRAAALGPSVAALDIVEVSTNANESVETVASVYFDLAERLDLTWLRDRILALPRNTQWETLARLTLRGDLHTDHRALTASVVTAGLGDLPPDQKVEAWIRKHDGPVSYFRQTMADIRSTAVGDLTNLLVASREVRSLISRTS
jgi:glutamate dehydrogenase